jgi:alkanesulfonate monooxygenase SsuD/methylene tetrahydromethanopterin reductase-like flavin-dependent oxidoreductase (luciferase family)
MKFGLFDHVDRGSGTLQDFYEDRLKIAEKYDEAGFYAYHTAEHHGTTLGMASSPNVYMAAVAQRTKRLRFGPLVYCLPQYHPIRLVEEICILDQMSGGRLQIGVGKGISAIESGYYGVDVDDVTAIYQEYYQIIIKAMSSDQLTFDGKYFSVVNMPIEIKPFQTPHPPIWTGISTPNSTAWPAENGINIISNRNAQGMRQITDSYRVEWKRLGRDVDEIPLMGMTRFLVISETDDKAMNIGRRAYDLWYKSFMKLWWSHKKSPPLAAYTESFDGIVASGLAIAGSAKTVQGILENEIEESGINYFVSRFAFGDISYNEAAYSIDAFSEMYLSD